MTGVVESGALNWNLNDGACRGRCLHRPVTVYIVTLSTSRYCRSLPGAVLSVSAQKVPKEAARGGVELIAPAREMSRLLLRCPVLSLPTARLRRSPTAATRSGRLLRPRRRSPRSPSPGPLPARTFVLFPRTFSFLSCGILKSVVPFNDMETDRFFIW